MKTPAFFIIVMLAALSHLPAETEKKNTPPDTAPKTVVKTEEVVPVELKNKSSFEMEGNSRNPFWPIGWKPSAKFANAGVEQAGPDIPPNAFVVTSITIEQGTKFAIVNGKVMQEGQQFGLQLGNQTYQVTLKAIEDGRVIVSRRDQDIAVPLRRK